MSNFEDDWILSCAMDRLSTPRILGHVPFIHLRWWTLFHRAWNRTRTIIHSLMKTMIILALQLYIGAELSEEIIGEESAPKGVNQPLVEGAQKLCNERSSSFLFLRRKSSTTSTSSFSSSLPSSFLFLERSHEEFQVRGSWKDEVGKWSARVWIN